MSGEIAIGVLSLIIVFSFAMSQYLINLKLLRLNERLVWFTGSMESHSALMLRLEAKKQGVRTIWWNPEEEPFADRKAAVRITLLKPPVLTPRRHSCTDVSRTKIRLRCQ